MLFNIHILDFGKTNLCNNSQANTFLLQIFIRRDLFAIYLANAGNNVNKKLYFWLKIKRAILTCKTSLL